MDNITAVTILIHHNGRFLGVSRKDDSNAFGLPGGKVDPGETPQEAAVRELFEETGLAGHLPSAQEVFRRKCEGGPDGVEYFVATYTMDTTGGIFTNEKGRVAWISKGELLDGPFGRYNAAMLNAVKVPVRCCNCLGSGEDYGAFCTHCGGKGIIVPPNVLLVDDCRTQDRVISYPEHYDWTVCKNNMDAVRAVASNSNFDIWFMDYSLDVFGRTTVPFLEYVNRHHPEKWPTKIVVVSEHDRAYSFAQDIMAMNPETDVTCPRSRKPVVLKIAVSAEVAEMNTDMFRRQLPNTDPTLPTAVFHVYSNAVTPPTPWGSDRPNVPWHDANKKHGTFKVKPKRKK